MARPHLPARSSAGWRTSAAMPIWILASNVTMGTRRMATGAPVSARLSRILTRHAATSSWIRERPVTTGIHGAEMGAPETATWSLPWRSAGTEFWKWANSAMTDLSTATLSPTTAAATASCLGAGTPFLMPESSVIRVLRTENQALPVTSTAAPSLHRLRRSPRSLRFPLGHPSSILPRLPSLPLSSLLPSRRRREKPDRRRLP